MRDAIEQLSGGYNRKIKVGQYDLVKVGNNAPFRFYAVDLNVELGEGACGKVYKAYSVNSDNGLIVEKYPFVAKIVPQDIFDKKEFEILARYEINTDQPTNVGKDVYLFTEFHKGSAINFKQLNALTFEQRIDFICKTMLQLNLMHHNTPTTKSALAHLDLKPDNILGDLSESRIIDFGQALDLEDSQTSRQSDLRGSPQMIPPEMIQYKKPSDIIRTDEIIGEISTKSDIYMIAPVFMMVLGEEDPYKNCKDIFVRMRISIEKVINNIKEGFYNEGMKDYLLSHFGSLNQKIISNFIQRMCHTDCEKRATSDESLRFFITLRNYFKLRTSHPSDQASIDVYLAKLILLSSGLWLENISTTMNEITFEQYFFECNSESEYMAHAIIKLYEKELLNKENVDAFLYLHKLDNNIDNFLDKKTPKQLKEILTYTDNHNMENVYGKEKLNSIKRGVQSKLSTLVEFKAAYKAQCINGWFLSFRSSMAKKVYTDTLTNQDINVRMSDNDKRSTTYTAYHKIKALGCRN